VLGLAVGAGAGAFVSAPRWPPACRRAAPTRPRRRTPRATESADEEEAAGDGEHEGEGEEEGSGEEHAKGEGKEGGATTPVYTIENLVLNPAQSGGTRFLLLSIAFELKDEGSVEELKARDAELRDLVLATVGKRTVEELTDMTIRDSLKVELQGVAKGLLKKKSRVRRIYFPQFVIQ
jgi:flagellar FliL protein